MMLRFRGSASPILLGLRSIRTQIPPRPALTVIAYLDKYGNPIRTKEESDLSLVRTRDGKFFLQRIYANEAVVRWPCPGLQMLKNASSYEYFSMADIDNFGGVIVPADVFPTPAHDPPSFLDGVYAIKKCELTEKLTRKHRRSWHRRLFSHWQESPEKYRFNFMVNYSVGALIAVWFLTRYFWMWKHGKSFWDEDPPEHRIETWASRAKKFGDMHPEHSGFDVSSVHMSPGQHRMVQARSDMRQRELQDTSSWDNNFLWKFRHAYYYKHWPKDLY